jgi:hypothetical protein
MSLNHSPSIVTDSLLLNLDFKNIKKFSTDLGTGNLVQNPNYNASTWANVFPANTTLTTGIDAPDGSLTAVRLTCKTIGQSILRVAFTSFTPNGTDNYNVSFFVRKISGTTGSGFACYLNDSTPTGDYTSQLITNRWVRVSFSAIPTATARTFFDLLNNNTNDYVLDYWGLKIEIADSITTPTPVKETISNAVFNLYKPNYYTFNDDSIQFTRSASTPKDGGRMFSTMTGSLTAANFLYNNHTWEIWFKINDRTAGAYDVNEGASALSVYSGYHAGFYYGSTYLRYVIWNGPSTDSICAWWTLGASGAQINEGSWYQIVVVNSGGTFIPYINGAPLGIGSTPTISATGIGTGNNLFLGAGTNVVSGAGSYNYYSKNTISNMKMYNRALSATEVSINFNALRGRFSI